MLDFDLAEMYGMETRVLKQAVRRNMARFEGHDFMFQLSMEEYRFLRSQIVTLKTGTGTHSKYAPFAFTELGVAMLSSVLNSEIAIEINRNIMRAFTAMRQLLQTPPDIDVKTLRSELQALKKHIEEMFADQNDINEDTRMQMELINEAIAELQVKNLYTNRNEVGYLATLKRKKQKQ